jgi:hypothetical protein
MSTKDAINIYRKDDCILPCGYDSSNPVIPCRLKVKICNIEGHATSDAVEGISPELYIRTDRGIWNVFHKESIYLIPNNDINCLKIQICTKERSNIMKAAIVFEFINAQNNEIVAISDKLLVLSKPPTINKQYPFAKARPARDDEKQNYSPLRCIKNEKLIIEPEMQSQKTIPCTVISLGTYRNQQKLALKEKTDEIKSIIQHVSRVNVKRERDENEYEVLQDQVIELQNKIKKLESEKIGLSKALKILSEDLE